MNADLAAALLRAIHALDFAATADLSRGGAVLGHSPSIDLAVAAFKPGAAPRWANVMVSREHPQGLIAATAARAGSVLNIRYDADLQGADGASLAWLPGADWSRLPFRPLQGSGARFVAPYPASLLKLMVAVGVGLALDRGRIADWPAALEPMLVVSDNDATTELVALLHHHGLIELLHQHFAALGLHTLQLRDTKADGGWRNADGCGVGHIHMTAWDTVRLLWLLDAEAPPPPWLAAGAVLLQPPSRDHLRALLQRQQLDQVLSSGSLRAVPGWVAGAPDAPAFAHKTGTTDNYASDAGIVRTAGCHYIVALLSSLGRRYAPDEHCATTWRVPALGAAVHALMESTA